MSFTIGQNETLGLVGESGSGKTMSSLALLRLVPRPGRITGRIRFDGADLLALPDRAMANLRGNRLAMVFQNPAHSLNPLLTIGAQLSEIIRHHKHLPRAQAADRVAALLQLVGLSNPRQRMRQYPHEMSGGMKQRVCIARALLCDPALILADEPTTALDVTIQAQILDLLADLGTRLGTSMLLVTTTWASSPAWPTASSSCTPAASAKPPPPAPSSTPRATPTPAPCSKASPRADRPPGAARAPLPVIAGRLPDPRHPPSGCRFHPALRRRHPRLRPPAADRHDRRTRSQRQLHPRRQRRGPGMTLVSVEGLVKEYPGPRRLWRATPALRAVDTVSFTVDRAQTLGLVGESGCGKTTVARSLLHLIPPTAGRVAIDGADVTAIFRAGRRDHVLAVRRAMQYVFQDPLAALNPAGPSITRSPSRSASTGATPPASSNCCTSSASNPPTPSDTRTSCPAVSASASASPAPLAVEPRFLICDEPVSSLDVSIRAQILNLLADLQDRLGLAQLYISHDLASVRSISHRVAVMYLGRIVEHGPADDLFAHPRHHYTRALLAAIPIPDPDRQQDRTTLTGEPPSLLSPPSGCHFHPRCPAALPICRTEAPPLTGDDHRTACHNPA